MSEWSQCCGCILALRHCYVDPIATRRHAERDDRQDHLLHVQHGFGSQTLLEEAVAWYVASTLNISFEDHGVQYRWLDPRLVPVRTAASHHRIPCRDRMQALSASIVCDGRIGLSVPPCCYCCSLEICWSRFGHSYLNLPSDIFSNITTRACPRTKGVFPHPAPRMILTHKEDGCRDRLRASQQVF